MRRMAIITLGGALALVGAAACDSEDVAENLAEEAAGDDVDLELGGDVPDCFPEDTPVPDGELLPGAGADGVCTFAVQLDGDVAAAVADYQSALEDDGWNVSNVVQGDAGDAFTATNGDLGLAVAANTSTGGMVITSGPADIAGIPSSAG